MNSQPFGKISLSPLPGSAFLAHVSAEACEQLAARFAGYASTGHQAQILECCGGQRTQLGHFVAPILSAAPRLIGHLGLLGRPVTSPQPIICQASGRWPTLTLGAMACRSTVGRGRLSPPRCPPGPRCFDLQEIAMPRACAHEQDASEGRDGEWALVRDAGPPCEKKRPTKKSERQTERAFV